MSGWVLLVKARSWLTVYFYVNKLYLPDTHYIWERYKVHQDLLQVTNGRKHHWRVRGEICQDISSKREELRNTQSASFLGSVQLLSCVWLSATPWTAACQVSLSITNSQGLLKLMAIESLITSNHLILCCPPLLPPSIFPSIRVFSNESVLHIRWPEYWSFSFSISPSSEYSGLIFFRMDRLDLLAVQGTQESSPTPQFKSINSLALSFLYSPTLTSHTWLLEKS